MRLWSLHPRYLDSKGLVAAWREGLLAQRVLEGRTRGYRAHPQLERFAAGPEPLAGIARYLGELALEAGRRGYRFDGSKIGDEASRKPIPVGGSQLRYELELLRWKLGTRDPAAAAKLPPSGGAAGSVEVNGAFIEVEGGVAAWERPIPEILARLGVQ